MTAPKILVVALESWPGIARLPRALKNAGFEVGIACRVDAFMAHTRHRDHFFILPEENRARAVLSKLESIIREWPPSLIIATDDQAALVLARACQKYAWRSGRRALIALLNRSFGNASAIFEAASKRSTLQLAHQLGVRAPLYEVVSEAGAVLKFAKQQGFPVVLKRSVSGGGTGVIICRSEEEVHRGWSVLNRKRSLRRKFYRWRDRMRGLGWGLDSFSSDRSITVNQFIQGKTAMSLAACVAGQVSGVLTAFKEQSYPDSKGPSSVVRFMHNDEICRMTETMINHWKLTGFIAFDFIVDDQNKPWLLECNPRPTPIIHLGPQAGIDLSLALYRQMTFQPMLQARLTKELVAAHFPQERWRDPHSSYLTTAFHDVPWDDAALLDRLQQAQPPKPARSQHIFFP